MSESAAIAERLRRRVRKHNRERTLAAFGEAALGLVFSAVIFGLFYCFAWFIALLMGWGFGRSGRLFPLLATAVYFLVSLISAWREVNPFAGLKPLTDAERTLTIISHSSSATLFFNPRLATAGAASFLLAGPTSLLSAFRVWCDRLPSDDQSLERAATVLAATKPGLDADRLKDTESALLLRRLRLIKPLPQGEKTILLPTERGETVLLGKKALGSRL